MDRPLGGALPRLVALDLDGTLLTSDKRLTSRGRAAVRELNRRGVRVVLCTGRPPRSSLGYAAELGLSEPYLCFNGAAVVDPAGGRMRVRHHLDPAVAGAALARLKAAFPGVTAALETDGGWFLDPGGGRSERLDARFGDDEPTAVGPIASRLDGGAIKLLASLDGVEARELAEAVRDLPLQRTWSSPSMLELLDPHVDKRSALEELCAELGVARAEVAAFGDQRNDMEMIAWAGIGVAMANASDAIRDAADLVAPANDADGVASVLEGWLEGAAPGSAHHVPTSG